VAGKQYVIKHLGTSLSQVYTLATTGGQTIGGIASGSYALYTNQESLKVISDGANWQILEHYARTAPVAYTPTFTGLGTVTSVSYFWSRRGNYMKVGGSHANGTVAASLFSMTLPSSSALDSALISLANTTASGGQLMGHWTGQGGVSSQVAIVTATGTSTTLVYAGQVWNASSTSPLIPTNANSFSYTSGLASIDFEVPISGWRP
jgi:hypothetical protein